MILYTAMPLELVLEGLEQLPAESGSKVRLEGVEVQLSPVGAGKAKVTKIFSTNPQDYLRLEKYLSGKILVKTLDP